MTPEESAHIVNSWLALQRHWWAYEALQQQVSEQPEDAWPVVLALVQSAEDSEMLETIGAGPLEDLIRQHSGSFVERVESEASTNSRFRLALGNVWLPRSSDPITERLVAVGCQLVAPQS